MRYVLALLCVAMFLTACSGSAEKQIRDLEGVKLYLAMNDDAKYSETHFGGGEAAAIADLVKAECPQGVGDEFVRATLESKASTLTIYTDEAGKNITCSVLKPKPAKEIAIKPAADAPNGEAVVVNGQPITVVQIQQTVAALPSSTPRDENTANLVVNQMINTELLRQAAKDVEVSDEDVAKVRVEILAAANVTEDGLAARLAEQNVTAAAFDASVLEQAKLQALFKERLLMDSLQISEQDAKEYYLQNPNQFLQSEQAVARFLLVGSEGRTLAQGQTRAQEVADKLNSTDFCQLVKDYSDDVPSKDNCGVYVIARGGLDANLELAAFSTPVNQTSVVTTDAGIYFVQKLQVTPAQVVPFGQISSNVQSGLRNALFQQRLNLYIMTLRSDAEIVSYLG